MNDNKNLFKLIEEKNFEYKTLINKLNVNENAIINLANIKTDGEKNYIFLNILIVWISDLLNENIQLIFKTIVASWLSQTKNLEKKLIF